MQEAGDQANNKPMWARPGVGSSSHLGSHWQDDSSYSPEDLGFPLTSNGCRLWSAGAVEGAEPFSVFLGRDGACQQLPATLPIPQGTQLSSTAHSWPCTSG